MNRVFTISFVCLVAMFSATGCTTITNAQRQAWAPRKIADAPYESSDPKVWDRYFLQNKGRIGSEAAKGIIERAIDGLDNPEVISARLTEMGLPNKLYSESRTDPDGPPRINFGIPKSKYAQNWLEIELGGDIVLSEDGPPYPVKTEELLTGF